MYRAVDRTLHRTFDLEHSIQTFDISSQAFDPNIRSEHSIQAINPAGMNFVPCEVSDPSGPSGQEFGGIACTDCGLIFPFSLENYQRCIPPYLWLHSKEKV